MCNDKNLLDYILALCIIVQLGHMLLTTLAYTYKASREHEQKACASSIVGIFDVCGYVAQLKYTICDICRPCQSILSELKPVFHHLQHIHCAYNFLWCLDL